MGKVARYKEKYTSQDSASAGCSLSQTVSSTEIQKKIVLVSLSLFLIEVITIIQS